MAAATIFWGLGALNGEMKHTLPWNVNGIPPEAREAARAAAMKEGLSVGDWLTRRILAEGGQPPAIAEIQDVPLGQSSRFERENGPRGGRDDETRRDRDELEERLTRSGAEAESAIRRIDEAVRAMSRRLDSNERSHGEVHRAVSNAAMEINAATREQAQAFASLTQRIDRVERQNDTGALREAVRALHQGLSRLADQFARTASESTGQITALANNVENLAGRLAATRDESSELGQVVDERISYLSDRLRQVEERGQVAGGAREAIAKLEARLNSSEERIDEMAGRSAASASRLEQSVAALERRLKSSEERAEGARRRGCAAHRRRGWNRTLPRSNPV